MSDTKDNDSSEENEERRRRNKARLEMGLTPKGVQGRHVPTKEPAPPADFNHWARQDSWHTIDHGPMLIKGFEPVDVQAYWWPPGFEDILNIQETARTSIYAGRLREWEHPRIFLEWAREKGYPIPEELEEAANRFHPKAEGTPQVGAEETPEERRARITARHQELKAGGNRRPTKTVAEEEGITASRVRQLMSKKPKANEPSPPRPFPKSR